MPRTKSIAAMVSCLAALAMSCLAVLAMSCLAALASGCGARTGLLEPRDDGPRLDGTPEPELGLDGQPLVDRPRFPDLKLPPPGDFVYAHSASVLYRLDPGTMALVTVGAFAWPAGSDSMTDLALSRGGLLVGISYNKVYAVNPKNAACVFLASLPESFNALAFLPTPDGGEDLIAAASSGALYRINPASGQATKVGAYGSGYQSSGDLCWTDTGVMATVNAAGTYSADQLVRVDPLSGKATPIGPIGLSQVWGLASRKGKLLGFTSAGHLLEVDRQTGQGTVVGKIAAAFWGAASIP